MKNITIGRYEADPEAQGMLRPEDGRWQLVVDKDGYPHLYVQVKVKDDEGNDALGMLCVEDMLPEGMSVRELMDGEFSGELPPEEQDAAYEEWLKRKEEHGIPCPRPS